MKGILQSNQTLESSLNSFMEELNHNVEQYQDDAQKSEELARTHRVMLVIQAFLENGESDFVSDAECARWVTILNTSKQKLGQWVTHRGNAQQLQGVKTQFTNQIDSLYKTISLYMGAQGFSTSSMATAEETKSRFSYQNIEDFHVKAKKALAEITVLTEQIESLKNDSESDSSAINALKTKLVDGSKDEISVADMISDVHDKAVEKADKIKLAYDEIVLGVDGEQALFNSIKEYRDDAQSFKNETKEHLTAQAGMLERLREFYVRVYGDEEDESIKGIDEEIADHLKKLTDFEDKQEKKYTALNEQIESLLPAATSAGLASAYETLKSECDTPIKDFTTLFYLALLGLFICSSIFVIDSFSIWPFSIEFVGAGTWTEVSTAGLKKIPFVLPFLWLTVFASKRRSEQQRLRQEYAHKEALAKSYESYKQQIEDLGEENQQLQARLLERTIEAIAFNASTTLDKKHSDGTLAERFAGQTLKGGK
ncbi:hypothetical protein NMS00_004381 [Vibrio alginolyticus]|uniref:hypothetical protein n=1 Tax=Vibrio harveyi group TaxID=717610 RepID=UPI0015D19B29|nr:hypothetical protein [Vibrio parahaemolyticus]EJL6727008.1 hypothetical protein [Vibrio alginolyticus]EHU4841160.1 hypothetical protein [Vibrio parahaemolyticus]EHU5162011.1 hypothetical protein [Vibrio parahaemolyticus]NYU20635.1 hypothetical protein [Vibrio parahaemolyticus]HCZ9267349.1 hypothetical protein [Vibrio alginolyticus]